MKTAPSTTDEYLLDVPEPQRSTLNKMRAIIHAAVPGATESISYRIPTINCQGPLIAFAAFKKHCSIFPMSGTTLASLDIELAPYKRSKGTLQFPIDRPLPAALVKKIVKTRLKEKLARAANNSAAAVGQPAGK